MEKTALLTVKEVAEKLGISTFRVYRRIHRGDLPAVPCTRGNTQFLVAADDLQDYIGNGEKLTAPRRVADSEWVTTGEAAILTGYTMSAIRNLCYSGRLDFLRGGGAGGHLKVSRDSLQKFLGR